MSVIYTPRLIRKKYEFQSGENECYDPLNGHIALNTTSSFLTVDTPLRRLGRCSQRSDVGNSSSDDAYHQQLRWIRFTVCVRSQPD